MTTPVGLVDTAVAQVQNQAEALGLAWQVRIAEVLAGDTPELVKLRMDGDSTAVTFGVSMVGPLAVGARVYVISTPPAGQYVVGWAQFPAFVDGVNVTTGALASGFSAETDIPELALSGRVLEGYTYLISVQFRVSVTVTTDDWGVAIRRDTALVGTQIAGAQWSGDDLVGTHLWQWPFTAAADETLSLFVSVARSAGTGTISVFGSPGGGVMRTHSRLELSGPSYLWRTA